MSRSFAVAALALLLPGAAFASPCDALVKRGTSLKGPAVVPVYEQLVRCDAKVATAAFDDFVRASAEVQAVVDIALLAIDAGLFAPVWDMLDMIKDYGARDEIAAAVGKVCGAHPQFVPFVQGAFHGVKAIKFGQWERAMLSCDDARLAPWMAEVVSKPPASTYDDKYVKVTAGYVSRVGAEALPILEKAAIAAGGNGGPFPFVIEQMEASIQPADVGASPGADDVKRLRDALIRVANGVGPQEAALVADRLYNEGASAEAASLLPRVYPDRVQPDGRLLYGLASVEICAASQQAVVHLAPVSEPARRWTIVADVEQPARTFKPRLKKCAVEWTVVTTPEPVADAEAVTAWGETVVQQWQERGFTVKVRPEKALALP